MSNTNREEPVLVIMAAGMGSRFGGLKQIEPVSGEDEIILDFSLYDAMMAGFKKAVLIIKEENLQDFKRLIDDKAGKYMDIEYVFQKLDDIPEGFAVPQDRVKPWGTGHAVLAARKVIKGPFAVINADDYYGQTAFQVMYDYLENAEASHYTMIAYQVENTLTENGAVARGVCQVENGMLTNITERTKIYFKGEGIAFDEEDGSYPLSKGTPVSMNFWGFTADFMKELEEGFAPFLEKALRDNPVKGEYFLPFVVDKMIKQGKCDVRVLNSADKWYGVTYKEDKEAVVAALQSMKDKGEYPDKLWK